MPDEIRIYVEKEIISHATAMIKTELPREKMTLEEIEGWVDEYVEGLKDWDVEWEWPVGDMYTDLGGIILQDFEVIDDRSPA